ncbi:MAG: DUF2939 domain-containing protein [Acetobacteraceae bacterium]
MIGAVVATVLAYGIYPYVTLYRLGEAIRSGDAATLESMVNWDSVREGIKEDICDLVIDQPQVQAQAGDQLPPFGAGFVRGIATNVVDKRVTPQALVAAAAQQQPDPQQSERGAAVQVGWAFFTGPYEFVVDLITPGQITPIRLQMDLRHGTWHVTRVWLPPEMLGQGNRT